MATKDNKDKPDGLPQLSQSELKLIALGAKFAQGGAPKVRMSTPLNYSSMLTNTLPLQVDYDLIAKYGGYTKGSAQVLYRKVLRKLTDSLDVSEIPGDATDPATPGPKTPKTPRSRKSNGKRGKGAAAEDQNPGADASLTPGAPGADAMNTFLTGAGALDGSEIEPITPSKRPRKTPVKKAVA
jgi:hypothetical protein